MRLRSSLYIVGLALLVLYFASVGYSQIHDVYSTEIAVTLYSDYEFDEQMKTLGKGQNILIVQLTDQYIEDYPIIKELIDINLSKEIPKNDHVEIIINYEELEFIFESLAPFYAEKFGGAPEDYISINDQRDDGDQYYYKFEEDYFKINNQMYSVEDLYPIENFSLIEFEVHLREANHWNKDKKVAELTNQDLQKIPKLKEVIDEIGKYEKNVQSRKGVLVDEFNEYREWAKSLRLVKEDNSSQKNAFIEYDGKKYHIYFRDV